MPVAGKEVRMPTRLYVGNLPFSVAEEAVRELFGQAGSVQSVFLPVDKATGQPRGFGFVEMATNDEASKAIQMFDGHDLGGRRLRVNFAEERGGPRGGGGHEGRRRF